MYKKRIRQRKYKKNINKSKKTIEPSIENTNATAMDLSKTAMDLSKMAEKADEAVDTMSIAIEKISKYDVSDELNIVKDAIIMLNKYNQDTIKKTEQFSDSFLSNCQTNYDAVISAEVAQLHREAQAFTLEYANAANNLVEKYRLARTAALELVSTALTASRMHSAAADAFDKVTQKIEEMMFFSEKEPK
jgi:hypothetical protein